ncbi:MAG: nitrogen regulation protein NR(I) [Rhodospirillaceae bacterium]
MKEQTVLVADDDAAIRTVIAQALGRAGFDVKATGEAATLWELVAGGEGDIVITDVVMPDENGLDLVPRIREIRPELRIIVMSAQNTILTAVKAAESGAFEYLPKPFDINELVAIVRRGLETPPGQPTLSGDAGIEKLPIVGRSQVMQDTYRTLARLISTDLTVLISGESGTGKELAARVLHDYGKRKNGPFVAVNMAAIPRELIESELFGHEKGAFTGATSRSSGRFEQAEGGTLFLDEIGDMPLEAQTRLLRVLQEGEYSSIGGRLTRKTDVRIIAATHQDLQRLTRKGQFREDLYYRLNVVPLRLPPLRERREDIPELVNTFLTKAAGEGLPWKIIDGKAMNRLMAYHWPGNVRELENMVHRLAALYSEETITAKAIARELGDQPDPNEDAGNKGLGQIVEDRLEAYFSAHGGGLPATGLYDRVLREIERPLIVLTLRATKGNQVRAAEVLGLNRNTLRKKIRELEIPVTRGGG